MSKGLGKYLGQMLISIHKEGRHIGSLGWVHEDGRLRCGGFDDASSYEYYVIDRYENDAFDFVFGEPFDISQYVERDKAFKKSLAIGSMLTESMGLGNASEFGLDKALNGVLNLIQGLPEESFEKAVK